MRRDAIYLFRFNRSLVAFLSWFNNIHINFYEKRTHRNANLLSNETLRFSYAVPERFTAISANRGRVVTFSLANLQRRARAQCLRECCAPWVGDSSLEWHALLPHMSCWLTCGSITRKWEPAKNKNGNWNRKQHFFLKRCVSSMEYNQLK